MESNNLTTRTYTAPTCALIVSSKTEPRLNRQSGVPMDFVLHLEDPDRSETDRITLHGQSQQLARLHQVVNKYISELVAQFPLPGAKRIVAIEEPVPDSEERKAPTPEPVADTPSSARLNPNLDPRAARSGILKNLPGLLKDNTSAPPPAFTSDDRSIIDKLLGRKPKPDPASITRLIGSGDGRLTPNSGHQSATNQPYLTGVSNESVGGEVRQRSLDHQLHLGNLATPASGETIVLSAIQLFDLATVLDEYASEQMAVSSPAPSTAFDRVSIPVNGEQPIDLEAVVSRSRLPNLPHMSSGAESEPIYYRTRRTRSSWMSALPWAVGATIAMVGGLFILDPNFKPFQDIASMMKSPSLGGPTKSTPVKPGAGELAQTPTSGTTTTNTTGTLPTPWQQQPVQPPQVTNPIDSSTNAAQTPGKLGVAPLPDAIATQPGQTIDNPLGTPSSTTQQSTASILSGNGVAPNPLNATQPSSVATKPTTGTAKTTNPASKAKTPTKTTTASAQLPTEMTSPGKISVSNQPMAIPPLNAPASVNPPFKALPSTEVPNQIDPAMRTSAKRSATQAAKPTPNAVLTPSSSFEPFTPVPRNPNLIDPNQPNSATPDLQNPPVVPDKPLQSNAGGIEPEVPLLQESRRYFQGKWKAGNNQPNSLQYVVQVNGKSGVVRSIDPQGEAASAYLRETKFIKPGQKLVSPAAAGSSDQKIRVLFQPDGNVDTFIEP
ncbi:DUF4335 domain-containing protein [Chamaesiphon minutus]|uniref:DUF4335 domain-containing protein n=1 Tax=Chamaesiphon minutus (strain ATCC 27169 / PCC 6605) TaxID=1173020 RepID=K9URE1_CHAP6|nr:DUF4335 domain-containing protein [Chamaesiphon minutus]AFY96804.1 hypothetical protein Cha6605_5958 [Chamaesiphon minutus PCC 6605]